MVSKVENYSCRALFDNLTSANQVSKSTNLTSLLFEVYPSYQSEALNMPADAKGLISPFNRSEGSEIVDLATPIFSDVMQQDSY